MYITDITVSLEILMVIMISGILKIEEQNDARLN